MSRAPKLGRMLERWFWGTFAYAYIEAFWPPWLAEAIDWATGLV